MKKLAILSILLLLIFSACRKNIDETNITEITPDPPTLEDYEPLVENINASVKGFVTDENDEPATGVTVSLNGQNTTTDAYGHFFFKDMTMNARGTFVKVEKVDYFEGSRRFFPLKDSESYIKIALLPKKFDYSFTAQNGGTITTTEGTSIVFKPNSIKTVNGTPYTGDVQVATKWLDPTAESTFEQMPGDLQGVNTSNEEVALISYGMMAVELKGTNGEKLNIANSSTATLSIPVPASLMTNAPATIPLWSFNETFGVWVEEGKATLQNGKYVGDVSHFSFWNCDVPANMIYLKLRLVDENQHPLPQYCVRIARNQASDAASGLTSANGEIAGYVPKNEVFTLTVTNLLCNSIISTQNIGPFDIDTDLGTLQLTGASVQTKIISGELLNCALEPIENGLIIIKYAGRTSYQYIQASNFEFTFNLCENTDELEIKAIDLTNTVQSEVIEVNIANTNQINLGQITTCEVLLTDYIKLTVDGVSKFHPVSFQPTFLLTTESTIELSIFNPSDTTSIFYMTIWQLTSQQAAPYSFFLVDETNNWRINFDLSIFPFPSSPIYILGEQTVFYNGSTTLIEGTLNGRVLNSGYQNDIIPPKEVSLTVEYRFSFSH